MRALVLSLVLPAFALGLLGTWVVRGWARAREVFDSAGVPGQDKAPRRRVPNVGGIAIFWAIVLPLLGGVLAARAPGVVGWLPQAWSAPLQEHLAGIASRLALVLLLVACLALLHVLGLVDDRRPLPPWPKLLVMSLPAVAVATIDTGGADGTTRLLTMLDASAGGTWLSVLVTVLWFLVVTNAMNFLDNMDGLSAGVGAIAGACFLAAALSRGQWFVGACLALLVGALLGFLCFNFPWRAPGEGRSGGASIFMGDGGSLVLGFLLAFLTARTTYVPAGGPAWAWYPLLMPLVVLCVPLYDLVGVVIVRVRAGRSPLVGDQNHLSHRIARRGLSRRGAVLVIYLLTLATGLGGIVLATGDSVQALLVGAQTLAILGTLALFEWSHAREADRVSRSR